MAEDESLIELLRSALADMRELVHGQFELMRAEIHQEAKSAQAAGLALGGAVFAGLLGLVLFLVALGNAIAYWFNWPVWAGYGIVSLLLFAGAYAAIAYAKKQLSNVRALPNTRASLKENLTWIRSKSAPK